MPLLRIDKWSDIPRAIAAMQQAGAGHRVPLLQALYRGRIALLEARRPGSSKLFKQWAAAARLPAVAVIPASVARHGACAVTGATAPMADRA